MKQNEIINQLSQASNFAMDKTEYATTFIDPFRKIKVVITEKLIIVGHATSSLDTYELSEIVSIDSSELNDKKLVLMLVKGY